MVIETTIPHATAARTAKLVRGIGAITGVRPQASSLLISVQTTPPKMPFRLLVVETDPAARAAMDRMLSTAGNMVTSVAEVEAAEEPVCPAAARFLTYPPETRAPHSLLFAFLRPSRHTPHPV